jgi:hypothetical protein
VKLLRLIRRRHLAYELLAEHDAENLPVDHERWKRAIDTITSYTERAEADASERWLEAIARIAGRYPE